MTLKAADDITIKPERHSPPHGLHLMRLPRSVELYRQSYVKAPRRVCIYQGYTYMLRY